MIRNKYIKRLMVTVMSMVMIGNEVMTMYAATATDKIKFEQELITMLETADASVHNVRSYNLTWSEYTAIRDDVLYNKAKLAYECYAQQTTQSTRDGNYLAQVWLYHGDEDFPERYAKAKQVIENVKNQMTPDMSDVDKLILIHDYIVENTVYKFDTERFCYMAGAPLTMGFGVCSGYATAMDILLKEVGIETKSVYNTNHQWSLVKLDGEWYHVDPTWNDTRSAQKGEAGHTFLLRTDSEFKNAKTNAHTDFENQGANSAKYSNWYVHDIVGSMRYYKGYWYYSENGSLYKNDTMGNSCELVVAGTNIKLVDLADGMITYTENGKTYQKKMEDLITVTPNPTNTPKITATSTPKSTNTPKVTAVSTPEPTNTLNPTNVPKATITSMPTVTATPKVTITNAPKTTVTAIPKVTITNTPKATVIAVPKATITDVPKATVTAVPKATITDVPKATVTATPRATVTAVPKVTITNTPKATVTVAPKPTEAQTQDESENQYIPVTSLEILKNNSQDYFDTGIKLKENYDIEFVFGVTGENVVGDIFSFASTKGTNVYLELCENQCVRVGYSWVKQLKQYKGVGEVNTYEKQEKSVYFNGEKVLNGTNMLFNPVDNLRVGGTKCKIYSLKIWDEKGKLIRDYIPALDVNGEICLYDVVFGEATYYTTHSISYEL